jgi:hypothetical protein
MRYNDPTGHYSDVMDLKAGGAGGGGGGGALGGGSLCRSCLRHVLHGLAVTATAAAGGYAPAEGNTRRQAGAKPISSDVGGNTASPMPTPDPDSNDDAVIHLGRDQKDWTQWYRKGLVRESLRDNPNLNQLNEFRSYFHEAANNASRIHFHLDRMNLTNVKNAIRYDISADKIRRATDFELYSILRDRSLFSKTDFYMGGEKLSGDKWVRFYSELADAGWIVP